MLHVWPAIVSDVPEGCKLMLATFYRFPEDRNLDTWALFEGPQHPPAATCVILLVVRIKVMGGQYKRLGALTKQASLAGVVLRTYVQWSEVECNGYCWDMQGV